uniref:ubiquitinyl hydrolase 1 n=1 Tax=Anopheles atroparvus TaxID=41427 RepID=A0A182J6D7_ANOAO
MCFADKASFSKSQLDQICQNLSPNEYINPHRSILGLGNYDVNVIISALQLKNCEAVWFDKRKDPSCIDTTKIVGFILNVPTNYKVGFVRLPIQRRHWIAVRQINNEYWNLDSKLDAPQCLGDASSRWCGVADELCVCFPVCYFDHTTMASPNLKVNVNNLEKIENFFNDSTYKEIIENSESFNTRLCLERRLRMPFLDPQTGVAQNHCALFMHSRHRIPGMKDGQVYSYPAARWRKSRRQYLLQKPHPPFPAYTHRPFGHLQPAPPPTILPGVGGGGGDRGGAPVGVGGGGSMYDSENSNLDQASAVDASDLKEHESEKSGKDWYYDEMEMHDMESFEDHDLPDSDCDYEESFSQRKKKSKGARSGGGGGGGGSGGGRSKSSGSSLSDANNRRGGRGGGRGRGRKSQGIGGELGPSFKDMVETPKKNRVQTLPNLTPQSNSSSPLTLPGAGGAGGAGSDELPMPELVPEVKNEPSVEAADGAGPPKLGNRPGAANHTAAGPGVNSAPPGPTTGALASASPPVVGVPASPAPGAPAAGPGGPGGVGAVEKSRAVPSPYCDFCLGDARENKKTLEPEELVSCSDCGRSGHPSCLQFTANMIISVRKYRWQCIECKYCTICGTSDNDDQLLFCDDCDRGYHMYCLSPPLVSPPEGSWSCKLCKEEFHKPK